MSLDDQSSSRQRRAAGQRLSRFNLSEARGVLRAVATLCRVAVGLRLESLPHLLGRLALRETAPAADPSSIERAVRQVRRAHRLVPLRPNCLLDSLTVAALLRHQGYTVPLVIGVKREGGEFRAHAWVDGADHGAGEGFHPLFRIPS